MFGHVSITIKKKIELDERFQYRKIFFYLLSKDASPAFTATSATKMKNIFSIIFFSMKFQNLTFCKALKIVVVKVSCTTALYR